MNRSFRAAELQAVRGRSLGAMMKDKEEDLALFLEMRKRDNERNNTLLLHNSDELDPPLGSRPGSCPIFKIVSSTPGVRKAVVDDFLNSDCEKNDYDWLLTPPGTPLFPSLEAESHRSPIGQIGTPKARPTMLKSRLANSADTSSRSTMTSTQAASSSVVGTRRPTSSGGRLSTASRLPTPTGRPTLPTTSKPSRPSTPTSRVTVPSKPRSSLPCARSSTPTSVSAPNRPASRSEATTPTRRTSAPPSSSSAPPRRSSSVTKSSSRASESSTTPSLKPSERPSSASRGRHGGPSSRSPSVEAGPNVRPRRQSCSPSRGRALNVNAHSGSSIPAIISSSRLNDGDGVNPVLIGSKMVERVVNVRRLVPPNQDDQRSTSNGKSSSAPDSSGFGRTLSKTSLDMALRHMDIRRSIPNSQRPLMTKIPASSMYSVRSGTTSSRPVIVSDSPSCHEQQCQF